MVQKANTIEELLQDRPVNSVIGDNLIRAWSKINSDKYKKIACAISGGSDSDVMLDIVWKCDKYNKVTYVWFDTGLEYQATKEHLKYLEDKYNIKIESYKAIKPIPLSCKQYGQPFLSKQVSEFIQRLQYHNFQWEDEDFDTLYKKYPKCKSAIQWWCNVKQSDNFNIRRNKYLKEYIIQNNPTFKIFLLSFISYPKSFEIIFKIPELSNIYKIVIFNFEFFFGITNISLIVSLITIIFNFSIF